ncbi:hypothetical protein PYCCODRAFT_1427421 [Trametes coccinea BRFM310]|uniref:Uncharacterized protein n=1 Tax=Trametes coccinea (strain BRFM310) TaxID=1353009 RepID=A0A1Y2IDC2_TRAC3|nr:hypothetical protein PYCCODRAFT_1427421 [Trametes coccinea BRFM310]
MSTAPPPAAASAPAPAANGSRDYDSPAPSFDALLRQLRLEVARVLQLPPESRPKEEPALVSLANRALARYPHPDRSTLPSPLLQIDAYQRSPNPTESLTKYLDARRAILALDGDDAMDAGDKDAIGEPALDTSLDAARDSDEDAIGSEHPRSPSFGPSAASPVANHTYTGDERCTNCIARNNPTCVVNSSRQRCDSCFLKRHRCSKVPTPPTRPARESNANANTAAAGNAKSASTSKGKAAGDAPTTTNGESASARSQKRKRPADVEDTKRPEPAAKRPTRPSRPSAATTAAAAPAASTSASAPVTRVPAQKREKPPIQNGVAAAGAGASASALTNPLNALAASASRAPRAPAVPVNSNAHVHAVPPPPPPLHQHHARLQYYQDKLKVVTGMLEMLQGAVKDVQDQIAMEMAAMR